MANRLERFPTNWLVGLSQAETDIQAVCFIMKGQYFKQKVRLGRVKDELEQRKVRIL